jgi:hypothetical protein
MTRKQLQLLSIDELRGLRHKLLGTICQNNVENNRVHRELLRIKKEFYVRDFENTSI